MTPGEEALRDAARLEQAAIDASRVRETARAARPAADTPENIAARREVAIDVEKHWTATRGWERI